VKFGEEEGRKPGPDLSTTTIGENIPLKLKSNVGKVHIHIYRSLQ
jgi:translation initiation factor 3 subunit G